MVFGSSRLFSLISVKSFIQCVVVHLSLIDHGARFEIWNGIMILLAFQILDCSRKMFVRLVLDSFVEL